LRRRAWTIALDSLAPAACVSAAASAGGRIAIPSVCSPLLGLAARFQSSFSSIRQCRTVAAILPIAMPC
jgi:hypothetical protein